MTFVGETILLKATERFNTISHIPTYMDSFINLLLNIISVIIKDVEVVNIHNLISAQDPSSRYPKKHQAKIDPVTS